MENEKQINLIKRYYDLRDYIPDFINTKSNIHKSCFNMGREIFNILSPILNGDILTEKKTKHLWINCMYIIKDISELNFELALDYVDMIGNVLNEIEEICVEDELFEIAANIKKLQNIYASQLSMD